jgi:WD40 repeat protein
LYYFRDLKPGPNQYKLCISSDEVQNAVWPSSHTQTAVLWNAPLNRLYTGSSAGCIHVWDPMSRREISFHKFHEDHITDLVDLKGLNFLASSSLDGSIKIIDMLSLQLRQVFKSIKCSILSLTFCESLKLIVAVGASRVAFVYHPYSPLLNGKLIGHNSSLVKVESIPNTIKVITADVDGIFKLWDLKHNVCLQTFTREFLRDHVTFAYIPSEKRLCCGLKALRYFEQASKTHVYSVADSIPAAMACFNKSSCSFITSHGRNLNIWNAIDGQLLRVFKDITAHEISYICIDSREVCCSCDGFG